MKCPFCYGVGRIDYDFTSRYIPRTVKFQVLKNQKWRCNFCEKKLQFDINSGFGLPIAHIDHIHPYSDRENYHNLYLINELENLQALCEECNLKKGKKRIN